MLDYVKAHGQGKLSALVFVATGYNLDLRPPDKGGPEMVLGPGVIENTGPMAGIPAGPPGADLDGCGKARTCSAYARQLAGTKRFLDMVPGKPLPAAVAAEALAYNMQTPPYIRRAMVIDRFVKGGPLDHSPTLGTVEVPVLFILTPSSGTKTSMATLDRDQDRALFRGGGKSRHGTASATRPSSRMPALRKAI